MSCALAFKHMRTRDEEVRAVARDVVARGRVSGVYIVYYINSV